MYTITAGGEGIIKIWKFDQANTSFEIISTLEGHLRDITCLVLVGTYFITLYQFIYLIINVLHTFIYMYLHLYEYFICTTYIYICIYICIFICECINIDILESRHLWSGSADRTIRVWDINSGRCIGILNANSGGMLIYVYEYVCIHILFIVFYVFLCIESKIWLYSCC
jgi:WD40 repeat protein